ncbi:hypothetical protein ACOMHN_000560 [Nucella lapillus]
MIRELDINPLSVVIPENCAMEESQVQSPVARIVQGVILAILCLVTVAGNLLLWVTVLRFKDLHKVVFVLLLNLSVSDLFLGAANMSLTAYAMLEGG